MKREIKFEICVRRKDGSDLYYEILTLDDLLNRNGSLFNPSVQEIVYKREFTGLRDKNGKEIYEGDIVRHIVFDWSNVESVETTEITFIDGAFGTPTDLISDLIKVEVIGSVWENPELIKQ
jgi:uncharacterized phage protein (TIGR01671 family)